MSECNGRRKGSVVEVREFRNHRDDYTDEYVIEFRHDGDVYWLYCNARPSNDYDDGVNVDKTHLHSCCGQICVSKGKEPRSMEFAEAFAHYWMSGYSEMARTGEFPDDGAAVEV